MKITEHNNRRTLHLPEPVILLAFELHTFADTSAFWLPPILHHSLNLDGVFATAIFQLRLISLLQ